MRCDECRFWSEMLAESQNGGVAAVCLNEHAAMKGKYTHGSFSCMNGKENVFGAIDQPGDDVESLIKAYEQYDLGGAS